MVREVFKRIPQANAVLQAAEAILKEGAPIKSMCPRIYGVNAHKSVD